jgi:flagellar biosynthesis component FlhA
LGDDEQPAGLHSIAGAVGQRMAELGVTRAVRLSAADQLEAGQIRIRVNDRIGQPVPVARPGEVAVQVPPSSLGADGSAARLLVDAASGHQLVALPAADAALVEQDGFAPLSPEAFLVVAIVREITSLANRLIDIEDVDGDLADLELSHADLVHSALRRHSRARITQVFRGLLAEQVSIRDVWMILNALVRFESIPLPAPGLRLFDNRVPVANPGLTPSEAPVSDLVSFVRLQMKGPLTWDSGLPGSDGHQLNAYTIDARVEAALRRRMDQRDWTSDDDDDLRRSVGRTLGLVGSPADAVLLVPAGVRVALHEALAREFPSLRVIARTEVPPETSVNIHHVLGLE